jgi:hypothetical protein
MSSRRRLLRLISAGVRPCDSSHCSNSRTRTLCSIAGWLTATVMVVRPPPISTQSLSRKGPRMKLSTCARFSCRRITTRPLLFAAHTANTFFAKSIPIVVTSIADPCIFTSSLQDGSEPGRGRPKDPWSQEAGGERGSPRPLSQVKARTVAGGRRASPHHARTGSA